MKLFTYFRSSAAYRVRIALLLKNIEYEPVYVHLRRDEQQAPAYASLNPLKLIPILVDGPNVLSQSVALLEYLEERHPEPPLLPADPLSRARVRSIVNAIACDIHPLNNMRVLKYLSDDLKVGKSEVDEWYRHWIDEGFTAIEAVLAKSDETGTFCFGEQPTLADVCLVPQVANARRLDIDMAAYPTLARIDEACRGLPAFAAAAPENQPDAED